MVAKSWLFDLNKLVRHTRHRDTFQMHHHYQIKMHHQLHQAVAHQHLHQDLHMEHHHHNMAVIRHKLDRHTRPDHRIRLIRDNRHFTRIITLHSMVIRAIQAGLVDTQDSLNLMVTTILKVNITNNSTVITDNQGIPDIMDIKIMVTTITMVKRTKTKVQLNNSFLLHYELREGSQSIC